MRLIPAAQPYGKSSVQAIPLGQIAFSFSGPSQWADGERSQRWVTAIADIFKEIAECIPACYITRLIVATAEIGQEVTRWQRELGQPEVVTSDTAAVTAGKTFVWGGGELSTTYAVIIISEWLAAELVDGGNSSCLAKALIIHELAHVHDYFFRLRRLGRENPPWNNDWLAIRPSIAFSIWGDFFAESIASVHLPENPLRNALRLARNVMDFAFTRMSKAKTQYHTDGNINPIWAAAGDELSKVFNQLGRALGAAAVWKVELTKDELLSVGISWYGWSELIPKLNEQLLKVQTIDDLVQNITNIEKLVEQGFNLMGLYPQQRPEGLLVSIR
jgi:hypothetical protein